VLSYDRIVGPAALPVVGRLSCRAVRRVISTTRCANTSAERERGCTRFTVQPPPFPLKPTGIEPVTSWFNRHDTARTAAALIRPPADGRRHAAPRGLATADREEAPALELAGLVPLAWRVAVVLLVDAGVLLGDLARLVLIDAGIGTRPVPAG
jgi:hypothetical protein